LLGALPDQVGQAGHGTRARHAIPNVVIEADAQLLGRRREGLEGVPALLTLFRAGAETDIAFAHALPGAEFGRIVMQRELGMVEHQQQAGFLEPGLGNPVIELLVAGGGGEDTLEFGRQPCFLGWTGVCAVA